MYQIDNPTVSATLPAPSSTGTPGYFTDGNPATGSAPTVVPAEFLNAVMMELINVILAAGLVPSKTNLTQVAAAIRQIAQSYQVGLIGPSASMAAIVGGAATPSLTFTDEQVIVGTALNGTRWPVPSFNQTLNLATSGAGGMDIGAPPASGFVAVYAGFNTTSGARTVFAQAVGSSAPSAIYSGANAPAGYNATALISILPTNGAGQFPAYVAQTGRSIVTPSATVLVGGGPSTPYTAIALNTALPRGSKAVSGSLAVTAGSLAQANASLAPNAAGAGAQNTAVPSTGSPMVVPFRCVLSEDRRIYYFTGSSISNLNVVTTGYEF